MNLRKVLDGIAILRPYYKDPDGYHVGADHDVLYLCATETPLTEEDVQKMNDLGWTQDTSSVEYSPDEGWKAYV